jgi:hypothetical protein
MQDFYILQRTPKPLTSDQAFKWYYTVELLGPEGIAAGDDDTCSLLLSTHENSYVYILPLVRHLTADEAERIVEGYMRVTDHDFEIESSNVYRPNADFGHPFEYDIMMDNEARDVLLQDLARHMHNRWIQEKMQKGWRFGLNLDLNERTHPAMRPWDDLPERYRRMPSVTDKELMDHYSKNKHNF